MKHFISIIFFILGGVGMMNAQSIHFNFTNGTNSSYPLASVRKIDFKPDSMVLHFNGGSLLGLSISSIRYYYYQPLVSSVDLIDNDDLSLEVFPNPSYENITIHYCLRYEGAVMINIYDNDGRLVHSHMEKMRLAGTYFYRWQTSEKGTFIVSITANKRMSSKTFIIL